MPAPRWLKSLVFTILYFIIWNIKILYSHYVHVSMNENMFKLLPEYKPRAR